MQDNVEDIKSERTKSFLLSFDCDGYTRLIENNYTPPEDITKINAKPRRLFSITNEENSYTLNAKGVLEVFDIKRWKERNEIILRNATQNEMNIYLPKMYEFINRTIQ